MFRPVIFPWVGAFDHLKLICDVEIEQALVVVVKSRSSQIAKITTLKCDVHTDNMIALRQMRIRLGCDERKMFRRMVVRERST